MVRSLKKFSYADRLRLLRLVTPIRTKKYQAAGAKKRTRKDAGVEKSEVKHT